MSKPAAWGVYLWRDLTTEALARAELEAKGKPWREAPPNVVVDYRPWLLRWLRPRHNRKTAEGL